MKTYKHLWKTFTSDEMIRKSIYKAALGKKYRTDVKKVLKDVDAYVWKIKDYLKDFKSYEHEPVYIKDGPSGKIREIIVPKFKEQVVHHMIVGTLEEMFTKGLYKHTYSSIPGRGLHNGKKQVEKWIAYDKKNVKYVLKMDIKKFFNSIQHDILIDKIGERVKDEKLMKIISKVVNVTDVGLPLGFYTSQWFANWFLQPLDHYIKEKLGAKHYIRYMDDMVIFGPNKKKLHKMRVKIQEYLEEKLDLHLKDNWQVFRFDYYDKKEGKQKGRALDFMGFQFYRDRTILRKSVMLKMTRKARKLGKKGKENVTVYDAHQMMAYLGWLHHADIYHMFEDRIAEFVNMKVMKAMISSESKLESKRLKKLLKEESEKSIQEVVKSWN